MLMLVWRSDISTCAKWTCWWSPCSALTVLQSVFADWIFFPSCANSRLFSPLLLRFGSTFIAVSGSSHLTESIAFNGVYWFRRNIGKEIRVSAQACHQTSYYPGLRMWILRAASSGWLGQVVMIKNRAGVYLLRLVHCCSQRSWRFYMADVCMSSDLHGSRLLLTAPRRVSTHVNPC